ncbi:MAG: hypothetical protein IJP52_00575 [Paludibacteraceae bacterium]|nr:hypothetical protein [Paludibacteraceae bacterium]
MRNLVSLLLLVMLWPLSLSAAGGSEVCGQPLNSGGKQALISFNTNRYGDVVITLDNGNNTSGVTFRGNNGMGKLLDCFSVILSDTETVPATDYFTREYLGAGSTEFCLRLIAGKTLPEGAKIYYNGNSSVEWMCDGNNNAYNKLAFTYTYGTTCASLDTPVITSVTADGTITFSPVTGADTYIARFYIGHDMCWEGTVTSGTPCGFKPFLTDTYEVTVQAFASAGGWSDESQPYTIALTGDAANLPPSEVCELVLMQNNSAPSRALITAETDANKRIVISIKAGDGGAEELTAFRNNGMAPAAFRFNGEPATNYFSVAVASDKRTITLTPKSSPAPQIGRLFTYNGYGEAQNTQWRTSQNTNAYTPSFHFTYRYGTSCPGLATPVITAIVDSVPVFEPIEGADSYYAQVYLDGTLRYTQTLQYGDALHFVPTQTATYQVTLIARGSGAKESPESAPYDWPLSKVEIEVGPSEYCNAPFGAGGDKFYISFETLSNGDVEISIGGEDGTYFRADGMSGADLAEFMVGSQIAGVYFERLYDGDKSNTFTLHLRDTAFRPAIGDKIVFSGNVQYYTPTNSNAYDKYTFTYTYGSVCEHLDTPAIASIDDDGTLHLVRLIEGADFYQVRVFRDGFLLQSLKMQDGDKISFSPWHNFIYLVSVQAVTNDHVMRSAYSEPYEWKIKATTDELPRSVVCDTLAANEAICGHIYLTAETDEAGRIIFTLHGDPGTERLIFRASGLNKLTYVNQPITDFFNMQIVETDSSTMIFTPKTTSSGLIYTGDPIISSGSLEWISACNTNGYIAMHFTYLYGTTCTFRLRRLATPVIQDVSGFGVVSFAEVENADSYRVRVTDGDDADMLEQKAAPGWIIPRGNEIYVGFGYFVRVQAWPVADSELYRESLWSDAYWWEPAELPTDIDPVTGNPSPVTQKILRNSQILILRDGVVYNLLGQIHE